MEQPASIPGIVIAPMGVAEIIDAGFNMARRHYKRLFLVGAWGLVPAGFVAVVQAAIAGGPDTSGTMQVAGGLAAVVLGIASAVMSLVADAAVAIACSRIIAPTGEPNELDPASLYRAALGRFWAQLGMYVLWIVMAIPLLIVFPLGIYLFIRWSMAWPGILLERHGPISSLKRSWALTRGSWWHTFGVVVVAGIIVMIIFAVLLGILAGGAGLVGFLVGNNTLTAVLGSIASTVSNLLLVPFYVVYYIVLYYELRARNEGYDLSQRARQTTPM